mgnify:CR=1 FL=1
MKSLSDGETQAIMTVRLKRERIYVGARRCKRVRLVEPAVKYEAPKTVFGLIKMRDLSMSQRHYDTGPPSGIRF